MIYDHPLTLQQRKKSQKNYNRFCLINGASYMCLGESVIVLFAIRLDMPNTVISLIGTMMYLGYLLLPLGVFATARRGAARSQADFWICRNIAVLLVAASVAVNLKSHLLAGITLLTGAFLFYGFRAAGCVMGQPLMGDISNDDERIGLIARSIAYFYLSGIAALATISLILHFYDNLYVLVGIILFGSVLGVTSSTFIRNIDETSTIRDSARAPILSGLHYVLHTPTVFHLVLAWFVSNLSVLMIIPMSILALKRGCGISDTRAILFSLAQFAMSIVASRLGIPLTHRFGPRKLVIAGFLLLIPASLFWVFLPSTDGFVWYQWLILLLPFLLQGASYIIMNNALTHYFLMAVPKENQVGTSLLINLITGASAGIIGMLLAAGFIKFSEIMAFGMPPQYIFRWYFAVAIAFLCCGFPLLVRLETVIIRFREQHGEEELTKTVHNVAIHLHRR